MTKKRDPWFKFYPTDWRGDEALKLCSLAARGLWIEMLGYMHAAEERGFLYVAGDPVTIEDLARIIGRPLDEVQAAFDELAAKKIFSFSVRKGVEIPYSRKMVNGEKKAKTARKNGQSGGNPSLSNKTVNRASDNQNATSGDNQENEKSDNQKRTEGVKPQIPEARSQIPDSKKDIPSPPIPSSANDGGGQVDFDDLSEQVFDALGFDGSQYPAWVTLGMTLQRCMNAGCTEHDILDAAKQARASTEGKEPPGSPKYLEKIAARIRDERTAPVTAAPRRNHAPAPDTFPPEEQPWMKLRAELTSKGDPASLEKREQLKAAFKAGGDEAANALAEEFTKPKETA